jgi:hypothetical protein
MKSIVLTLITLLLASPFNAFADEAIVEKAEFEMGDQKFLLVEMDRATYDFVRKTTLPITSGEGIDLASKVMTVDKLGLTPVVIPVGNVEFWIFKRQGEDQWTFITRGDEAKDLTRFHVIVKSR